MSRTALMMSGFGDLSDEEEILTPSSTRSSPAARASPAAGPGVDDATAARKAGEPQPDAAGLSRLERLERLASKAPAAAPASAPVLAPTLAAAAVAAEATEERSPAAAREAEALQPEPEPEPLVQTDSELAVEFSGPGPLGLSFRGGRPGEGADVVVAQVASDGAAAGRVQPRLVLRKVQGVSVVGKTHDEVISSIRQAGRPLTLVFSPAESSSAPAEASGLGGSTSPAPGPPEEIKATFSSEGSLGKFQMLHCDASTVRNLKVPRQTVLQSHLSAPLGFGEQG